jgi:hypothetical protein
MFVVAPAIAAASWSLLSAAVAGTAAALGYKVLDAEKSLEEIECDNSVEVELEGSQVIAENMRRESQFVISNGDITATFARSADGRCTMHVAAKNMTEEELSAAGREIMGQVTQQYAYNKVLTELKGQGFTVSHEEVAEDKTIRIKVCKYV